MNNRDTTIYSFQSLKYPKWDNFKRDMIKDFKIISSEDNQFIHAISLNYLMNLIG